MASTPPVAALEIGTGRIAIAVAERQPSGRLRIIGMNSAPSAGVNKSHITELGNVRKTIASVVRGLQDSVNVYISNAMLAVSGQGVETKPLRGSWRTDVRKIEEADVTALENDTMEGDGLDKSIRMPLHYIAQDFVLDGHTGIVNPVGMTGQFLERRTLCVHYSAAQFKDACEAAAGAHVELQGACFSGCCAARAVLSEQEKQDGVLLVDLGAGSTSYVAYTRGYVAAAGSFPVGGKHVTSDLAAAFKIPHFQAETLKLSDGCAVIRRASAARRITLDTTTPGFEAGTVSARAVETVVNARMDEIFRIVQDRIDAAGSAMNFLNAGCVLTGGGAGMPRIAELATQVFGLKTRMGTPVNVDGLENDRAPAACAVLSGALMLAAEKEDRDSSKSGGVFSIFKRMFS